MVFLIGGGNEVFTICVSMLCTKTCVYIHHSVLYDMGSGDLAL
jgi:hypothetical protein